MYVWKDLRANRSGPGKRPCKKDEAPGGSFFRTALQAFLLNLHQFSDFCSRRSLLSACRFTSSYLGDWTTHRPFGSRNSTPIAKPSPCKGWQ
jgi:hypothetical protein